MTTGRRQNARDGADCLLGTTEDSPSHSGRMSRDFSPCSPEATGERLLSPFFGASMVLRPLAGHSQGGCNES